MKTASRCRRCGIFLAGAARSRAQNTSFSRDPFAEILAQAELYLENSRQTAQKLSLEITGFAEILAQAPEIGTAAGPALARTAQRKPDATSARKNTGSNSVKQAPKQTSPRAPVAKPVPPVPVAVRSPQPVIERVEPKYPAVAPQPVVPMEELTPEQQALMDALDSFEYDE